MEAPLKLGIIGHPVRHSLSPRLQANLMMIANVAGEYRPYAVKPDLFAQELQTLSESGVRGLNVTVPHKVAAMALVDWLSPEAELTGAVNTLAFEESGKRWHGYNTDMVGFIRSLPEDWTKRLPESHILVLGAGGAARAVMSALIQLNTAKVTFAVRDPEKSVGILGQGDLIRHTFQSDTELATVSLHSMPGLEAFQGLINTTPVGMWPGNTESLLTPVQLGTLPAGAFVYDLIYRPLSTRLLEDAKAQGLATMNGLDMLIHQGITSFEIWTGKTIPADMLDTLRQELSRHLMEPIPAIQ